MLRGANKLARSVYAGIRAETRIRRDTTRANTELKRAARSGRTIVVGPWVSEIGFEVLYGVPMLHWVMQKFDIDRDRVVVVTRGGAHCWYEDIAGRGIEIFDHFSPEEL